MGQLDPERTHRINIEPNFSWITATISMTGNMVPEFARRTLSGILTYLARFSQICTLTGRSAPVTTRILDDNPRGVFCSRRLARKSNRTGENFDALMTPCNPLGWSAFFFFTPSRSCRYQQSLRRISGLTCECTSAEIRLECGCGHVNGRSTNLYQLCVGSTRYLAFLTRIQAKNQGYGAPERWVAAEKIIL